LILTALTAILYLVWCNKSYKNLSALRITGMEFTPAQSVYLCFVPFLNFVRPFQILRELLAATSLSPVLTKVSPRVDQKPLVIYLWWTCVVVSMILNRVNSHRALNESNEQTLQMFGNASDIIQSLFWIAAGISLLYLLHTIHAQQIEQFKYVVRDDAHTGIVE
ncbi:MAG: DUF4328 domain-containing protein, partial [Candidatus Kapabacteria bacterium]|nr:DUF4328 domain-containing protein [Candidatus Kapabacteria bacterium]